MKTSIQILMAVVIILGIVMPIGIQPVSQDTDRKICVEDLEEDPISEENADPTRALDWSEWMDNNNRISVDGHATDWARYTPNNIGRGGNTVNLYMANDNSYLYLCVDAVSDLTNEANDNDRILFVFDGNNDNSLVEELSANDANTNTDDNWLQWTGNWESETSNFNGAGWLNWDPSQEIKLWWPGSFAELANWGYEWCVGFNGNPKHMTYEFRIPFSQWHYNPGEKISGGGIVWKSGGGGLSSIGIWPNNLDTDQPSTYKDFFLATANDRPSYSNPKSTPSTISNDGVNETLLTVEADDPDGTVSSVCIDLSPIGGGTSVPMVDDGTGGDIENGDGIYSYKTNIPTSTPADTYDLSFSVSDDHSPNVGKAMGEIRLIVTQANRPPFIMAEALSRIVLHEDQEAAYVDLTKIFDDPDTADVLTYTILSNSSWKTLHTTSLATYRVLLNDSIKISPSPDRFGTDTLQLKAKDANGLVVDSAYEFTVVVQPTNDPPHITAVNGTEINVNPVILTSREDRWSTFVFTAEDIDEDSLEFEINITEAGMPDLKNKKDYFFYSNNGTLRIRPSNIHVGNYRFQLTVDDGNGGTDSIDIQFSVTNTNDPPSLGRISTMYVDQDEWIQFVSEASDDDLVHGDTLTYSTNFSEQADGMLTDDNYLFDESTGEFRFKPDKYMVKTYHSYIRVEDREHAYSQRDFKIIVINVNDPPDKPVIDHAGGDRNLTVIFTADNCMDPDNSKLIYKWNFGDKSKERQGEDLYEIEHEYEEEGSYTVTLTLSDGILTSIATRTIDVTAPIDDIVPEGKEFKFWGRVANNRGGTGIRNAKLLIELTDDSTGEFESRDIDTDDEGRFEVLLPQGKYKITITKDNFHTNSSNYLDLSDETYWDIKMTPFTTTGANGGSEKESALSDPLILVLIGSAVLMFIAIFLIIFIRKRNRKNEEESATPHHISIQQPHVLAGPPPMHQLPPGMQYKALPPAPPARMPPSPPPARPPRPPIKGKMPFQKDHVDVPKGKKPVPEEIEDIKPKIVKPDVPRPPRVKEPKKAPVVVETPSGSPRDRDDTPLLAKGTSEKDRTAEETGSSPEKEGGKDKFGNLFELPTPETSKETTVDIHTGPEIKKEEERKSHDPTPQATSADDHEPTPREILQELAGEGKKVERKAAISGIFDGLDEEVREEEKEVDDNSGTLAKIPVKRMAISKDTGEELRICDGCGGYYENDITKCPHCSGRKKKVKKERCPSCGVTVNSEMIFCNKCGSNLKKLKAKRSSGKKRSGKDRNARTECPKCGKMLHIDMKFCNACGMRLGKGKTPEKKVGRRQNSGGPDSSGKTVNGTQIFDQVECYQCGSMIPVTTAERPVVVTCPQCNTQGQLE